MAYIGHFKNYYDISDASYFEYTLSAMAGNNLILLDDNNTIWLISVCIINGNHPDSAKYKSLDIKAEF